MASVQKAHRKSVGAVGAAKARPESEKATSTTLPPIGKKYLDQSQLDKTADGSDIQMSAGHVPEVQKLSKKQLQADFSAEKQADIEMQLISDLVGYTPQADQATAQMSSHGADSQIDQPMDDSVNGYKLEDY